MELSFIANNQNIIEKPKPDRFFHKDVVLPFTYQGKDYTVSIDFENHWISLEYGRPQTLAHQGKDGKWVLNDPAKIFETSR